MSTIRNCPYCHSPDVHRLNAAVTGVSGFRCDACAKIFYVASGAVAERIQREQAKREHQDGDEPLARATDPTKT